MRVKPGKNKALYRLQDATLTNQIAADRHRIYTAWPDVVIAMTGLPVKGEEAAEKSANPSAM